MIGTLADAAPYVGWVYPNETDIAWSALIVIYPNISGLVAGTFIVSSLYYVFGIPRFKPVARFALLAALCFLLFAPIPLLFHLGNPQRALNAMLTPHWTSAMAAFGYVISFFICMLLLQIWFAFRADIVALSKTTQGALGLVYRALALGSDDVSPKALAIDQKLVRVLAMIGIPSAVVLSGYAGFVFGSLKSREWWASDLMPLIFLFSATVSGVALVVVLYVVVSKFRKVALQEDCLRGLANVMWAFLIVVMVIEVLGFVQIVYKAKEGIEMVMALVAGPIWFSHLVQIIGSVLALILLTALMVFKTRGKSLVIWLTTSSVLVLFAVLAMRWNVVIGGQELSKTMKGLLTYQPLYLGQEGVVTALLLFAGPFVALWVLARLLPPWEESPEASHA